MEKNELAKIAGGIEKEKQKIVSTLEQFSNDLPSVMLSRNEVKTAKDTADAVGYVIKQHDEVMSDLEHIKSRNASNESKIDNISKKMDYNQEKFLSSVKTIEEKEIDMSPISNAIISVRDFLLNNKIVSETQDFLLKLFDKYFAKPDKITIEKENGKTKSITYQYGNRKYTYEINIGLAKTTMVRREG